MFSPGILRTWIITITLVSRGIALAIPAPPVAPNLGTAMDTSSGPLKYNFRPPQPALGTIAIRGMFASSSNVVANASGTQLRPVEEVLQEMKNESTVTGSLSPSRNSTPSVTATATSPLASSPIKGPGLVELPTTLISNLASTGRTAESTSVSSSGNATAANDTNDDTNGPSSHKLVILGTIIGGVICVTILLFFVLDPAISSRWCGSFGGAFSCRSIGSKKKDAGISHMAEPAFLVERGTTARMLGSMKPLSYSPSPSLEKSEQSLTNIQGNPVSKFSVYSSSDYLSVSARDSTLTSATESSRYSTTQGSVTFGPTPRPARPARPPTADSPTLSDSVYLACSSQPYVIVAPPSLKAQDTVEPPPRKMLTPSEFFALHVPSIIASLVGSSNTSSNTDGNSGHKRKRERATMAAVVVDTPVKTKAESLHSRTKSAPHIGSPRTMTQRAKNSVNSAVASDGEDKIVQRITKHRRSRSASGWAYPDRRRLRRTLAS